MPRLNEVRVIAGAGGKWDVEQYQVTETWAGDIKYWCALSSHRTSQEAIKQAEILKKRTAKETAHLAKGVIWPTKRKA